MTGQRCFVALELEPQVVAALLGAGEVLRSLAPNWRGEKWVAEDNLHVTLTFLGDVEAQELDALQADLGAALAPTRRFAMPLTGVCTVPSHGRRSMIWATLGDSEGVCAALAAIVGSVADDHGLQREFRPFAPHITLARARRPRKLSVEALSSSNAFLTGCSVSMSVLSATLFASTLTRTAPVYEHVASWTFLPDS